LATNGLPLVDSGNDSLVAVAAVAVARGTVKQAMFFLLDQVAG
jgi:hypothetical protein